MKGDSGGAILDVTSKKQVGVVSGGSEECGDYPTGMLHWLNSNCISDASKPKQITTCCLF